MTETILMGSAAAILGSLALVIVAAAVATASWLLYTAVNRWRVRGLTRAQIRYIRSEIVRLRHNRKETAARPARAPAPRISPDRPNNKED